MSYAKTALCSIKIKLVLMQTKLFSVRMLILIPEQPLRK